MELMNFSFIYSVNYCGMYVPHSDDRHQFVRDSSKSTLEIRDNVQDKIQSEKKSENFFSDKFFFQRRCFFLTKFFFKENFFSAIFFPKKIFFATKKFCWEKKILSEKKKNIGKEVGLEILDS